MTLEEFLSFFFLVRLLELDVQLVEELSSLFLLKFMMA